MLLVNNKNKRNKKRRGIGIDIGAINFIVISNGKFFNNICRSPEYKALNDCVELLKIHGAENDERIKTLENMQEKMVMKHIRTILNYIKQLNVDYITIEKFGACSKNGVDKANNDLVNAKPFTFIKLLTRLCNYKNIELRCVDCYYPSTKTCSSCGRVIERIRSSDFSCHKCGLVLNKDLNSAINLQKAKLFTILVTSK